MNRVAGLWQYVNTAYAEHEPIEPDSLRLVARAAKASRQCFAGAYPDRRIWLLHRESWSLDELGRYREAGDLVELFFRDLAGEASSFYLARFSLRRVRYRSFTGDIEATLEALGEAQAVIDVLTPSEQLNARLTAASLLLDGGQHGVAADSIGRVLARIQRLIASGTGGLAFAEVRARYLQAGADRMRFADSPSGPDQWHPVADVLEEVAAAYLDLSMPRRASAALADLGDVYYSAGDQALSEARLEDAFQAAASDARSLVYVHLQRGRVRVQAGQYQLAEADFRRGLALTDSSGIHKHTFDLLFEQARLDEQRRRLSRARRQYQAITEREIPFAEGAVRAVSIKANVNPHIRRVEHALLVRERTLLRIAVVLALLLAAFAVAAALSQRGRSSESDLATRLVGKVSLLYMEEILTNTKTVASVIRKTDRHLARRLSRGRLRGKMELYQCLALLINSVEITDLNGHSARMRLYRLFKSRGWDWPDGDDPIEAWCAHFEEHPLG